MEWIDSAAENDVSEDGDKADSVIGAARLIDVASESGVAIATVSRALNNPGRVNAKTRDKVIAVAERLGYSSNVAAQTLRSGKSRIIMAVMPQWSQSGILEEILKGIDSELSRSRYSMIVGKLNADRTADPRVFDMARGGLVDGVIAIANEPPAEGNLPALSTSLPTVGLLIDLSSYGIPSVVTDDAASLSELTSSLIAEGRRYLAYLSGPGSNYHEQERYRGFEEAAGRLRTVRVEGDYSFESGENAARWYLQQAERPDAIVCANDRMAIALIDALRRAGVKIPEQVAVTGFDDIDIARYCVPTLTTVRPSVEDLGASSARLLLQLIKGVVSPDMKRRMVTGRIVRRESF